MTRRLTPQQLNDTMRNANKYVALLTALGKAREALQALNQRQLTPQMILERLLPHWAAALMADCAFLGHVVQTPVAQIKLVAVHAAQLPEVSAIPIRGRLQLVVEQHQPVVINPEINDEGEPLISELAALHARAAVLVPLATTHQTYIVGVYQTAVTADNFFLASDYKALEALTELVAVGLRTGERVQHEHLLIHQTLSKIIAKTEINLDLMLPEVAQQVAMLLNAPATSVMLWRADGRGLEIRAAWQLTAAEIKAQPIARTNLERLGSCIDITKPFRNTDLQTTPFANHWLVCGPELFIELCVPLHTGGELLGFLVIYCRGQALSLQPHDIELAQIFAEEIAVAIHTAELYTNNQKQLRRFQALYAAGKAIVQAGIDRDTVLHTILTQAVEVTHTSFGVLRSLDQDDPNSLNVVAVYPESIYATVLQKLEKMPINGPGFAARAFRENTAQLVQDVEKDPDFIDTGGYTKGSAIAVVLREGGRDNGKRVGVLSVQHARRDALTVYDRQLLVAFSYLAVAAIQNANQHAILQATRAQVSASEAVAWLGISSADKHHTLAQKTNALRNCIDSLHVWIEQNHVPDEDEIHEMVEDLKTAADEIEQIKVTRALENGIGEPVTVDREIEKHVNQCCDSYNRKNRTSFAPILDLNCQDVKIQVSADLLFVAVEKLIHNALKSMSTDGIITVRTRLVSNTVQIDIEDTGRGIPKAVQEYFLKGHVPRPAGTGTGLGAFMALLVARHYAGDLLLINTGAHGTTLRFVFPALQMAAG